LSIENNQFKRWPGLPTAQPSDTLMAARFPAWPGSRARLAWDPAPKLIIYYSFVWSKKPSIAEKTTISIKILIW